MMTTVAKWLVYEACFTAQGLAGASPLDLSVEVAFTSPSGAVQCADAFWDGELTWRVRFAPDAIGPWTWQTRCADAGTGLSGLAGGFTCTPYLGDNPLYQHGPLRLAPDRRRLVHADDTPFFWLADTAWNGVLCAQPRDWDLYLATRRRQSFNVIQFVTTQWRAFVQDAEGRRAFTRSPSFSIDPAFFRKLDDKVAAVNAQGLIAAPVMVWSCTAADPGRVLPESDIIRLARYIRARWGAHQVVWILGGDGNYEPSWEMWQRVGRAVFTNRHDRLVTMHMGGQQWTAERFRGEPWFDLIGYQSGHGSSSKELTWHLLGPPVAHQDSRPTLPVINMEPNYEMHPAYGTGKVFGAAEVRRASYWSLLRSFPAGITFGCNPIWCWLEQKAPSPGHTLGLVEPWRAGLETPGTASMTVLRACFESLPWENLQPAQDVLAVQPGTTDPTRFIAVADSAADGVTVLYLPVGGRVRIDPARLPGARTLCWVNPRTGQRNAPAVVSQLPVELAAPDDGDWLLLLTAPVRPAVDPRKP